ncbi:MAG: hypothetical protein QOE76_3482, partial [Frankiales bacterium]|nr:hypothetical protein [Frankiales bacterium]
MHSLWMNVWKMLLTTRCVGAPEGQ